MEVRKEEKLVITDKQGVEHDFYSYSEYPDVTIETYHSGTLKGAIDIETTLELINEENVIHILPQGSDEVESIDLHEIKSITFEQ